jgi:glutaredoxin
MKRTKAKLVEPKHPNIRIFVFTAEGCHFCKPHKKVVDTFAKAHPEVGLKYIDVTTAAPEEIRFALDHDVSSVPTTFFVDPRARVLASAREACSPKLIQALFDRALANGKA